MKKKTLMKNYCEEAFKKYKKYAIDLSFESTGMFPKKEVINNKDSRDKK